MFPWHAIDVAPHAPDAHAALAVLVQGEVGVALEFRGRRGVGGAARHGCMSGLGSRVACGRRDERAREEESADGGESKNQFCFRARRVCSAAAANEGKLPRVRVRIVRECESYVRARLNSCVGRRANGERDFV